MTVGASVQQVGMQSTVALAVVPEFLGEPIQAVAACRLISDPVELAILLK